MNCLQILTRGGLSFAVDGDILRFDYNKYGRYGCCHRDEFTEEERYAIYELDKTQRLIRLDMEKLMPEQAQKANKTSTKAAAPDQQEELFHFIHPVMPRKSIKNW